MHLVLLKTFWIDRKVSKLKKELYARVTYTTSPFNVHFLMQLSVRLLRVTKEIEILDSEKYVEEKRVSDLEKER